MKKWVLLCCLLFAPVFAFGCVPYWDRHVVVATRSEPQKPLMPSEAAAVDGKILALTKILQKNGLSDKDKEIASHLLNVYRELKEASSRTITEAEYQRLVHILFKGLNVLEQDYISRKKDDQDVYCLKTVSLLAGKRKQIQEHYLSGDYKGVIDLCREIKNAFGPDALTPEIAMYLSLSLAKEGIMKEAISIGERVADELEVSPDLILLKIRIVEWLLQQDQTVKAIDMYEKLTDTLDNQEAVLNDLDSKIKSSRETIEPLHASITGLGIEDTNEQEPTDQVLTQIKQLTQEQRFAEARALLELKKNEAQSDHEKEILNKGLRYLEKAEEIYLEEKIFMLSKKKAALESAKKLIEEEKFEEALAFLDNLKPQQEDEEKIRALKEQAIENLINRERNNAAKIFLAAKTTRDPSKKKEYLLSSHKILKALIEKYPTSPLIYKIKDHMEIVSQEMGRVERESHQ